MQIYFGPCDLVTLVSETLTQLIKLVLGLLTSRQTRSVRLPQAESHTRYSFAPVQNIGHQTTSKNLAHSPEHNTVNGKRNQVTTVNNKQSAVTFHLFTADVIHAGVPTVVCAESIKKQEFTNASLKQNEAQSSCTETTCTQRMYLWWSLCTLTQVFVVVLVLCISSASY